MEQIDKQVSSDGLTSSEARHQVLLILEADAWRRLTTHVKLAESLYKTTTGNDIAAIRSSWAEISIDLHRSENQ